MSAIRDIWESEDSWEISEDLSGKEVDGKIIIGKVRGPFFVPNGTSRNQRFYPKELWESVLSKDITKSRLAGRMMFGMIGHEDKPVTEEDLRKGSVSHIVSNLWIDEKGKGMGEALILGTEAGRNLFIYLKAGSRLKTSSRAAGKYESAQRHNGLPIVDKQNYQLETFDFVLEPGFAEVDPRLVENKQPNQTMDIDVNKLVENLQTSRDSLQVKLSESLDQMKTQSGESATLRSQVEDLKKQVEAFTTEKLGRAGNEKLLTETLTKVGLPGLTEALAVLGKCDKHLVAILQEGKLTGASAKAYLDLGEAQEVSAIIDLAEKEIRLWRGFGNHGTFKKTLAEQRALLSKYVAIGTPDEINETVDAATVSLENYSKIGSSDEIKDSIDEASLLLEGISKKSKKKAIDESVAYASKKFGLTIEAVRPILESMPAHKAEKALEGMVKELTGGRKVIKEILDSKSGAKKPLMESDNRATRFFQSVMTE